MNISSSSSLSNVTTFSLNEKVCQFLNQIDKRIVVIAVVCLGVLAAAYFAYHRLSREKRNSERNPERNLLPSSPQPQNLTDPDPIEPKDIQINEDFKEFLEQQEYEKSIFDSLKIDQTQLQRGEAMRSTNLQIFDPRGGGNQTQEVHVFKGTYKEKPVTIFFTVNGLFYQSFFNAFENISKVNSALPVKMIGASEEGRFLITEDVGDRLWDAFPDHLDIPARLKIAEDLAKVLQILHAAGLNHPTLSPDSIFIKTVENQPEGVMVYFDEAKFVGMQSSVCKTPRFCSPFKSPEAFLPHVIHGNQNVETLESDVFTFGTILWSLFQGELPTRKPFNEMKASIMSGWQELEMPANCPDEIQQLMRRCWSVNPQERPTADEIVAALSELR